MLSLLVTQAVTADCPIPGVWELVGAFVPVGVVPLVCSDANRLANQLLFAIRAMGSQKRIVHLEDRGISRGHVINEGKVVCFRLGLDRAWPCIAKPLCFFHTFLCSSSFSSKWLPNSPIRGQKECEKKERDLAIPDHALSRPSVWIITWLPLTTLVERFSSGYLLL